VIHIYFLLCPFTGTIRYVGKTKVSLRHRLRRHITKAKSFQTNNHCATWIRSLLNRGAEPNIVSVEQLDEHADWAARESEMIRWAKSAGFDLTNATAGGDGFHEISPACMEKRVASRRKTMSDPGVKENFREAMRKGHGNLKAKQAHSAGAKKAWSNRNKKQAILDGMNDPAARQRRSEATRRRMQDPIGAAQHKQKMATLFQNPENREQLRQASLRRWALYRERKAQEHGT
jgi:hypothetical protein